MNLFTIIEKIQFEVDHMLWSDEKCIAMRKKYITVMQTCRGTLFLGLCPTSPAPSLVGN